MVYCQVYNSMENTSAVRRTIFIQINSPLCFVCLLFCHFFFIFCVCDFRLNQYFFEFLLQFLHLNIGFSSKYDISFTFHTNFHVHFIAIIAWLFFVIGIPPYISITHLQIQSIDTGLHLGQLHINPRCSLVRPVAHLHMLSLLQLIFVVCAFCSLFTSYFVLSHVD